MMNTTPLLRDRASASPFSDVIDAPLEVGAYEELWTQKNASFKSLAELFATHVGARPSEFVPEERARDIGDLVLKSFRERLGSSFNVRIAGEMEYPCQLRDAEHPVEVLYYQGWWDLVDTPMVAVVGTRKPSADGVLRTKQMVRRLVEDGFTIVSGLAEGVDTVAHETTIAMGGRTIAVIGTPLGHVYPRSNHDLQKQIAENHLLVSQVPLKRYENQIYKQNRLFFPERNKTMSALTLGTIIIEAGETSGTLIQAREALKQGRKLFILNSCFENRALTWPQRFAERGAIRVRSYEDVRRELVDEAAQDNFA